MSLHLFATHKVFFKYTGDDAKPCVRTKLGCMYAAALEKETTNIP